MPQVFTLFCHGTGSHRTRTDREIVTEFGKVATGQEYTDYLILDGPGSAGGQGGAVKNPTENPLPGTFDPYTRDKQLKSRHALGDAGFTGKSLKNPKFMNLKKATNAGGGAWGTGWDDNVIHAIAAISELDPLPQRVNMIGWSRGAVTCTKAAFKLHNVYPQIAVNIFAIDPVAGPGNKGRHLFDKKEDTWNIRENVRNYIVTLAEDERRKIMMPQDMKRVTISKMTNAVFLPFPGVHNTAVALRASEGEVAQVVWRLAYAFLTHFGTRFEAPLAPAYSGPEMCNLYGKMLVKRAGYKALYKKEVGLKDGKILGSKDRGFVSSKDKYVIEADYFINEHHREVFIRTYPKVYAFLFEGRADNERAVWLEFKSMYNLTGLMNSLAVFGVKKPEPGHPFVLPPPGVARRRGSIGEMGTRGSLLSMGVF